MAYEARQLRNATGGASARRPEAVLSARELIAELYCRGGHASPTEDGGWRVVCDGRVWQRQRLVDALDAFATYARPTELPERANA